jgi:hypothetical protein
MTRIEACGGETKPVDFENRFQVECSPVAPRLISDIWKHSSEQKEKGADFSAPNRD